MPKPTARPWWPSDSPRSRVYRAPFPSESEEMVYPTFCTSASQQRPEESETRKTTCPAHLHPVQGDRSSYGFFELAPRSALTTRHRPWINVLLVLLACSVVLRKFVYYSDRIVNEFLELSEIILQNKTTIPGSSQFIKQNVHITTNSVFHTGTRCPQSSCLLRHQSCPASIQWDQCFS